MFVVCMSRFCIAISMCDCLLQTRWLWYFLLSGKDSEGSYGIFKRPQVCYPVGSRSLTNGKQNFRSGTFRSAIVLSLHTCVPFTGKRLRGPAMVTKGGLKSWTTSFGRSIPTRKTDLLFDDLLLAEIFTWSYLRGTSGVTKSLSRLYTGRDQYKAALSSVFYF